MSRAIAVRSTAAAYHATLAEAFWAFGQLDCTVSAYQSALGLQPDHPEYHCNLGATLIDLGVVDEAITHFRAAIRFARLRRRSQQPGQRAAASGRQGFGDRAFSARPCGSTLARPRPGATWARCARIGPVGGGPDALPGDGQTGAPFTHLR